MNRKEAEDYIDEHTLYNVGNEDFYSEVAYSLIEEIYDDVENRTCNNCKYYTKVRAEHFLPDGMDCTANESGKNIVSFPPPDFGCIKFERI